jgi:hypothetical protein
MRTKWHDALTKRRRKVLKRDDKRLKKDRVHLGVRPATPGDPAGTVVAVGVATDAAAYRMLAKHATQTNSGMSAIQVYLTREGAQRHIEDLQALVAAWDKANEAEPETN